MDKLKTCPKCGKQVKVHGGSEEWTPTFYDPDSGGAPHQIHCKCGIDFCIGDVDYDYFVTEWNRRQSNSNEALTLEQLKQMDGKWVWIESDIRNGKHYSGWGKIIQVSPIVSAKIIVENPGYITEYDVARFNAKFYAHKPEVDAE